VAIQTEIATTNLFGQRVASASAGSGFVISDDGYILTNAHVVESATSVKVIFENGEVYKASIVGKETENDIAVLKVESDKPFKSVILGNSDKMVVGEDVVTIGNPLGELTFSLTKGVVSALNREIRVDNFTAINMFQVDCAVNAGNSGGPVFNMYGEVIGIVSAKYASETIEGLGFCIPTNDIVTIVSDLIEHGEVTNKAYMGVHVADVNETMIQQYNMVAGAYVSVIDEGSSAEKAGLKIGDIIVELDGKKVESVSDLLTAKRVFRAGDTAKLKVWRSGEYIDLKITFDEYVEEKTNVLEEANEQLQEQFGNIPNNGSQGNENQMLEEFFKYYFGY
jgi:serine protease Do